MAPRKIPGASPVPAIGRAPLRDRWFVAALAICACIVWYTARPVFENPQLEPDDYRYLHQVQLLQRGGAASFLTSTVVENRWDHLWWIDAPGTVRFFRPVVVLTYWIDASIAGDGGDLVFLITNILIYAGCIVIAALIFRRWLGAGPPLAAASALFASFYAHGDVMWYVAGRTDSLAVLLFLAALLLHISGVDRHALRRWAVPVYFLALLTKELALVLPLILVLHDLWIERRCDGIRGLLKKERYLYGAYAATAAGYLLLRAAALSAPDTGYPHPYFIMPWDADFAAHLWGQVKSYSANILLAVETVSFTPVETVRMRMTAAGFVLGIALLAASSVVLRREKKFRLLLLLAAAAWIPVTVVYNSERYLLLPSFAIAGVAGLLFAEAWRRKGLAAYAALAAVIVWSGHQSYALERKNRILATIPREPQLIARQLEELHPRVAKGGAVLILNLPGDFLQAQFMEDELRVQLHDPDLHVTVLSLMPESRDMGASLAARRENDRTIVVDETAGGPLLSRGGSPEEWHALDAGRSLGDSAHARIEILKGRGTACASFRAHLPRPIGDYVVFRWLPYPGANRPFLYRQVYARLGLLTL